MLIGVHPLFFTQPNARKIDETRQRISEDERKDRAAQLQRTMCVCPLMFIFLYFETHASPTALDDPDPVEECNASFNGPPSRSGQASVCFRCRGTVDRVLKLAVLQSQIRHLLGH